MAESLSSIISDLQDAVDELERHNQLQDALEDDGDVHGVIDCLELGLPHIVEKYGHSSSESEAVRSLIAKWK